MSIVIGVPVIDQHEITRECVKNLEFNSQSGRNVVIIDNASDQLYSTDDWYEEIVTNKENRGFYYPLLQLYQWYHEPIIGLIHNDLFIYEEGWDKRIEQAFADDPQLMLIGFCGSDQVDDRGGRGGGTMCNFAGIRGQRQEHTGRHILDLRPALILDSLAMFFRREAIPLLEIDDNIVPCHFYDKIWSLRLIDKGFRVAVMGIHCDHLGGQTSVGVPKYNKDAEEWCDEHGLPYVKSNPASAANAIYLEAERRMFAEFGPKGLIPSRVDCDYKVHRNIGKPNYPAGAHAP